MERVLADVLIAEGVLLRKAKMCINIFNKVIK